MESRTEFQRDYDRVLFSSAVRRLQHKAQVFPMESNDSVRTRLTHSHEVANVARSLGEKFLSSERTSRLKHVDNADAIPIICATSGLVHDLGNPPFGHAGEIAIQEWFEGHPKLLESLKNLQRESDFAKFEGNAQTLRLLCRLQVLADDNGLNFTYGTLAACRKYICASHKVVSGKRQFKKPGFFFSENDRIIEIENKTGSVNCRHPIVYLVEAADDMVYATVDLEDGVTKGALDWELLSGCLLKKTEGCEITKGVVNYINQILDEKVSYELSVLQRNAVAAQFFRTFAIGRCVNSVYESFIDNYDSIMNGSFDDDLSDVCKASSLIKACKSIGFEYVYQMKSTVKLEILGRSIIHDLMSLFWDAVKNYNGSPLKGGFAGRLYSVLSYDYRMVFEEAYASADSEETRQYARIQLVTDYVCGMTDSFACQLHKELISG